MHRTPSVQVKAMILTPPIAATMQNVAGQLAPTSRKTYTIDAKHFAQWLASQDLSLNALDRDDLVSYRAHLAETYAQSTAARMWTVARRLLDEAVQRGLLPKNPAEGIRGFKAGEDESPHRALKREEAKALLDAIDRSIALGKRDYALLMLLLRTGIRRACAPPEAPLFFSFRRGNHPQERLLHPNQVERIVKQRAQAVGIAMSPHGMRASFITLAFEGGADLALVQDGARHKDPRTTRRYQKRRKNLHKNAVDFVWLE